MRLAEEGFPDAGPSPLSWGIPNRLQRLRRPMGIIPLSRGILPGRPAPQAQYGIIPALAGNTTPPTPPCISNWDHPRSRGEYGLNKTGHDVGSGSSPLSRGIPSQSGVSTRLERIIPALAGNTSAACPEHLVGRDHPRSRGEYAIIKAGQAGKQGSSPLSRGIPAIC